MNPALLTPTTPKPVKREKKERIPKAHLDYLKSRAALHVREMIAEFFPVGRLGPNGQYWITPELRISVSTGCFWKNGVYSRRPAGDVLTLFLTGAGFLVLEERIAIDDTNRIESLKDKLRSTGGYRFKEDGSFQRRVQSLSEWLEQFPSRTEVHELVGYDS